MPSIYQLKIRLLDIRPPIWRRIQVPGTISLCCLHDAFQVVMGWTDSHLHRFEKDGDCWGVPESDEFNELDLIDERKTWLAQVLKSDGDSMVYLYDFVDDWRHQVTLEKIIPMSNGVKTPVCLAGKRRCPPDGVGGVSGYQDFLRFIVEPQKLRTFHPLGWRSLPCQEVQCENGKPYTFSDAVADSG